MRKLAALVTLHGMGQTCADYADGLIRKVQDELGADAHAVEFLRVYYQQQLQRNQELLWERCNAARRLDSHALRRFMLHSFSDAVGIGTAKDAAGSSYAAAQREVAGQLLQAFAATGGRHASTVVVAHSLGGQVFSSFLYDAQRARRACRPGAHGSRPVAGIWRDPVAALQELVPPGSGWMDYLGGEGINALMTIGCNIPMFVAAHPRMSIRPFERPHVGFQWHNYFDPQDVLGWPLQPLSDDYAELVQDHSVNVGSPMASWSPFSHSDYWTDAAVVRDVAKQLRRTIDGA